MKDDETKYRKCSVPNCTYKEIRGSREGAFRDGYFVCDTHALGRGPFDTEAAKAWLIEHR